MNADQERKQSKRKRGEDFEEIEIDVDLPEPLSKKAQRSQKKSKSKSTSNDGSSANIRKTGATETDVTESDGSKNPQDKTQSSKTIKKTSDYGIWIGNLSFHLNKDDLRRFFVSKSTNNEDSSGGIKSEEVIRIHMPKKAGGQNKGFAYVDFVTEKAMVNAISLSETPFEGRKVLIKDARVFDGPRSSASTVVKTKSGKPQTKVLFVGNLPFETKESHLQEKFTVPIKSRLSDDNMEPENITEIIKPSRIRMATFQDSGNCKGFAFIDYASSDEAEKVLSVVGSSIKILGRKDVKVEFGEDRSFRWKNKQDDESREIESVQSVENTSVPEVTGKGIAKTGEPKRDARSGMSRQTERKANDAKRKSSKGRITPGMALANSQRAKVSIVPSEGKKVVFTD
ncbi:hypothetical protein V1525DRAFT_429775 [Lipomyces kononenkoae]|uniref:Uncharacterized protein n=1 Tax=Lipomyces kononenkoae TaxID=34357 RepID=A0ACC3T9S4_LIPKO